MTKEEIKEKSNVLLTRMKNMNYSEFIIKETSIWITGIKKESLEQYFEHLHKFLDSKPNEEELREEVYKYSETLIRDHTPEDERRLYEEIIRRRNERNKE